MRRSTTKAAAAIVALSVAIPALANDGDYFIGPDGSIEYRDGNNVAAPAAAPVSAAPLNALIGVEPNYATLEPVRDVAVELPLASVAAPAPIVQELSTEILVDAKEKLLVL